MGSPAPRAVSLGGGIMHISFFIGGDLIPALAACYRLGAELASRGRLIMISGHSDGMYGWISMEMHHFSAEDIVIVKALAAKEQR